MGYPGGYGSSGGCRVLGRPDPRRRRTTCVTVTGQIRSAELPHGGDVRRAGHRVPGLRRMPVRRL